MAKKLTATHPEGWHDRGKKASANIMKVHDLPGSVRGAGGPGPKNAGGGGKAKGCGPNSSNDYDTTPSGYKKGR